MKERYAVYGFITIFIIALLFDGLNIMWYGQSEVKNLWITIAVFGGIGLFWFIYSKFKKQ